MHKLTNLTNFEIDRSSGSREYSKNRLHILHDIDANNTKREIRLYLSHQMTELFQGMFSAIIVIGPCQFYVDL